MIQLKSGTRVTLKKLLYLTDFSEPSQSALPFAISIARDFGSTICAMHILVPGTYTYSVPDIAAATIAAQEESAERDMLGVAAQMADLPHETIVERGLAVWPWLERAIDDRGVDLVVLGTHGRTGVSKLLLGSVAEEIFRKSPIPVLTIGPRVPRGSDHGIRFRHVLFATNFSSESAAAASYAFSFAQENQASLTILHVIAEPGKSPNDNSESESDVVANLNRLLPQDVELWCRPETIICYGNAAEKILEVAGERGVDLIVLGLRGTAKHTDAATHLGRATAHKVVAHALCPVLTVRG